MILKYQGHEQYITEDSLCELEITGMNITCIANFLCN